MLPLNRPPTALGTMPIHDRAGTLPIPIHAMPIADWRGGPAFQE